MACFNNTDDGLQHYRVLGLPRTAAQDDIKQAYRRLARTLHPDKGGNSTAFAALQAAFETLIDPRTRSVYDALAADVRFRPGAAAPYTPSNQAHESSPAPPPGVAEAMLLQQLLRSCGHIIDPARQLCVTCEVCRRPATKECWTCKMAICDFCTRRQHWKGSVPLHWPLVNAPGRMIEQLGKQEFELKRKEDALAYKQRQQGYRPQHEMMILRQFQDAVCDILAMHKQQQQQQQYRTTALVAGNVGADNSSKGRLHPATVAQKLPTAGGATAAAGTSFALRAAPIKPKCGTSGSSSSSRALINTNSSSSQQLSDPRFSSSSSKALAIPGSSSNKCLRAWQAARPEAMRLFQATYDYRLARFYMWTQTDTAVLLAVHMPTGGTSTPPQLAVEVTHSTITLQHQGFAPVLSRYWSQPVDSSQGVTSWTCADGRLVCLTVAKAQVGKAWSACFKGDSHGARCLQQPYSLLQLHHEVQIELPLPFWVIPEEDLEVTVTDTGMTVTVDGVMQLERRYWRNDEQAAKQGSGYKAVDTATSSWCVFDQQQQQQQHMASKNSLPSAAGPAATRSPRPGKILSISLALPEPTLEEIQYKKGVRQNNAAATRGCPHGYDKKGYAFFSDDEDEFGLGPVLQALMFHETGYSWITPKPWEVATGAAAVAGIGFSAGVGVGCGLGGGRCVREESGLPGDAQKHLKWLRAAKDSGSCMAEE